MRHLERFSLTLNGRQILHDITLRPRKGEFLALCGPNGAGKTSILRALAGLVPGGIGSGRLVRGGGTGAVLTVHRR